MSVLTETIMEQTTMQIENPLSKYRKIKALSKSKYPVYLAQNTDTGKDVVLKFFPAKNKEVTPYTRELLCLQQFQHPNVLELVDYCNETPNIFEEKDESVSYLALRFAKYGDLFALLTSSGPLPEKLGRTVFLKLVEGIQHLHSKGIAHLDIKPENILVDEKFEVVVADFDLSQSIQDVNLEGRGTPSYRAPEVIVGKSTNLAAADVYSLGVMLFILLTGIPPYIENEGKLGRFEYDYFYKAFRKNSKQFWESHKSFQSGTNVISDNFINLFTGMLAEKPEYRLTLEEVKQHEWCQGEIYDEDEYQKMMYKYVARGRN